MPSINDYKNKKNFQFKKKEYRPWLSLEESPKNDHHADFKQFIKQTPFKSIEDNKGTIREQLGNKQGTIREQLGNNKGTIREQLGNKQGTIREQLGNNFENDVKENPSQNDPIREQLGNNKGTIREQLGNNKGTIREQLGNNKGTIREQGKNVTPQKEGEITSIRLDEITPEKVKKLFGLQRLIVFHLVNHCILLGKLSTGPLSTRAVGDVIKADFMTLQTSIKRLINKGFFIRERGKTGRGGFVSFRISETLKNIVMEEQNQQGQNTPNSIREQLGNNPPISSSSKNITTTTKKESEEEKTSLPPTWEDIDISPLSNLRFGRMHLLQLYKLGKLTPEHIQESIYAFAFDLKENKRQDTLKGSPLNFFMGILRHGSPYLPPENYETPQEKALKRYTQAKREREERLKGEEQTAFEFALREWERDLEAEERNDIIPEQYKNDQEMAHSFLRYHFENKVWESLKSQILKNG